MVPLITVIIKNLPIIIAIFSGLGKALQKKVPEGVELDTEAIATLVAEITEREVTRIVEENKAQIRVYVPDEEDRQRQMTLDELERRLMQDMEDEKSRPHLE